VGILTWDQFFVGVLASVFATIIGAVIWAWVDTIYQYIKRTRRSREVLVPPPLMTEEEVDPEHIRFTWQKSYIRPQHKTHVVPPSLEDVRKSVRARAVTPENDGGIAQMAINAAFGAGMDQNCEVLAPCSDCSPSTD
jgi:hypothetical protein